MSHDETHQGRPPRPPAPAASSKTPPASRGSAAAAAATLRPGERAAPPIGEPVTLESPVTEAKGKKKKKSKDKEKKKDKDKDKKEPATSAAEPARELQLSDAQKEAARLRAEAKLKKEYERSVDAKLRAELEVDENELKDLKKKLTKVRGAPERGIETWFRLTSRNLYTRRQIVDTKCNILLTINSVILSVVLGTMSREIADQPHLAIAIVPLVVANLFSMSFAIFATRPHVATGVFTKEELEERRVSLMTFDDFYKMSEDDYDAAVHRILEDRDLLYGTIRNDIYTLGISLSRRYQQIQRAYSVFLTGVVFSTLLFGATSYYFA